MSDHTDPTTGAPTGAMTVLLHRDNTTGARKGARLSLFESGGGRNVWARRRPCAWSGTLHAATGA
jgi:hypothetical protein